MPYLSRGQFKALAFLLLAWTILQHSSHAQTFTPTRFTVVDAGTVGKPDVLLIPGLSSSRSVWDEEAKLLASKYRLHLVQVNGFAGQPAGANASGPMLPALVDELDRYVKAGRMHPDVVAHSLGGLLALMLADKHPDDVKKLVIVDSLPFYALVINPDATVENTKAQVAAMRQQMAGLPDDQYAAMQPMLAAALVKNPEGQKQVAASSTKSDRAVVLNAMMEDMQTDLRPDLPTIKTPTLVLYPFESGARQGTDPAKTEAIYASAFKAMPNVTLQRVDASRHFIMYDQPAIFDAAVQSFLK